MGRKPTGSFLLPLETSSPLDFEPRNPRYATQEAREKSFEKWPHNNTQIKVQLAEAGFYYTGMHCDGNICLNSYVYLYWRFILKTCCPF